MKIFTRFWTSIEIRKKWSLLFLFSFFFFIPASVRESEIEGLVGKTVRLPCEVDEETCGYLHNIKWYKGNERVYIFSDVKDVSRPEGSLLQRSVFLLTKANMLYQLQSSHLLILSIKATHNWNCTGIHSSFLLYILFYENIENIISDKGFFDN